MSGVQAWGTALLRVVLGLIYVMHGYFAVKVLLAPALAWYLILAHLTGGAVMIAGLWTRLAASLQVPIVDAATGRAVAGGYEYALLLLAVTLALALVGGGAASLDDWRAACPRIRFP